MRLIHRLAGSGTAGYGGDGGPAIEAQLDEPSGVSVDSAGNVYVSDTENHRVRRIALDGTITTVAGTGQLGDGGDGGPAVGAHLNRPAGLAFDAAGDLYIADGSNGRIRRVSPGADGSVDGDPDDLIATVAGGGSIEGANGVAATEARLDTPYGVVLDAAGNLYLSERFGHRVRRVDANGIITTVAGAEEVPYFGPHEPYGDGRPATAALLNHPLGLTFDAAGNLYVADSANGRVRRIVPGANGVVDGGADETITTVAGNEGLCPRFGGDGGPATEAQLCYPSAVAVDPLGNLYIADGNGRVRIVDPSGTIGTFAGGASAVGGDGGPATSAGIAPEGIALDAVGNLYVAEKFLHRVRVVGALSVRVLETLDPVPASGAFAYTVSVGNSSGTPASSALLTTALPSGVSFASASPLQGRCGHASGTVTCQLGVLPPSSSTWVQIKVKAPETPGTLATTASLVADHADTVSVDDTAAERTEIASPTLGLTMADAPDPLVAGETVVYTLVVTNLLPQRASEVRLTDALPAEVSFAGVSASQGSCGHVSGVVTCALGSLGYQATATVAIEATATTPGVVTNTATVRSKQVPAGTSAAAETAITDPECGTVLTEDTALAGDVGPCAGDGFILGADGITLDLGGHRVFGLPTPGDGTAAGVRLPNRTGVTLTNGTISGFDAGVAVYGGGGHTLSRLEVVGNVGPDDPFTAELGDGIFLYDSADNRIAGNTVIGNGIYDGIGVWGNDSHRNVIEGNLVEGTIGPSDGGPSGQGIIVNAAEDGSGLVARDTVVRDNLVRFNASAGISTVNSVNGQILRNTVIGNGTTNSVGNGIGVQIGPGAPPGTFTLVQGNEVHENGVNGIRLSSRAVGNTVVDNDAAGNNLRPEINWYEQGRRGFDLRDLNTNCAGNTWSNNTFGSGGVNPPCAAGNSVAPASSAGTAGSSSDVEEVLPIRPLPTGSG